MDNPSTNRPGQPRNDRGHIGSSAPYLSGGASAVAPQKLPHNLESERAVLGSVFRDTAHLDGIAGSLLPEHFYLEAHQKIYACMVELHGNQSGIDVVTVHTKLKALEGGDDAYFSLHNLMELCESCPLAPNVESYAEIVRNASMRRDVIFAAQDAIKKAQVAGESVSNFIEDIEKTFLEISKDHDRKGIVGGAKVVEATISYIQDSINKQGDVTGVPSGFVALDKLIGGWQPSDLVILAARPAMGKTALALNFLTHAIMNDYKTVFFSLEMSKEQLMSRVISSVARIDSASMRRGVLSDDEMDRMMEAAKMLHKKNYMLGIDETMGINIMELRSRCRRYQKEHGLDMIIVDYLQLMSASHHKSVQSREREISEISMGLKGLAKELSVPVISLSQLNRGPDARPDKRPRMSDLRESGSIEQDADMIFFIYRDEVYNPNSDRAGIAELIVGKNRHGGLETIDLAYQPNYVTFQNLVHE